MRQAAELVRAAAHAAATAHEQQMSRGAVHSLTCAGAAWSSLLAVLAALQAHAAVFHHSRWQHRLLARCEGLRRLQKSIAVEASLLIALAALEASAASSRASAGGGVRCGSGASASELQGHS